ncbi:MAG TPA: DinB family protein [Thermoanaerobaculia bacterium]
MSNGSAPSAVFITPEALLEHWQGHRRLTRRVIEAFPEDQLFTFSVGGMRPFGALAMELLSMAVPMVRGTVTDEWNTSWDREARPKEEILRVWDEDTEKINDLWRQIPPERFQGTMTAFGQYEGRVYDLIFYVIDNEIHHRGQGYVYLRALGIEPPPFYERH